MKIMYIPSALCIILSAACVIYKFNQQKAVSLMNGTFAKIEGKPADFAVPIVQQAYPSKTVKVQRMGESFAPSGQDVRIDVNSNGKVVGLQPPGGDAVGSDGP